MKIPKHLSPELGLALLRCVAGGIMASHGAARIYYRTVGGLGEFLEGAGFPLGPVVAWILTIVEILGGGALIAGFYRKFFAIWFSAELIAGIFMVHLKNGWFVVGHGRNGIEFSLLLVCALLAVALDRRK